MPGPLAAALIGSIIPSIIGGKQMGQAAPAFQPGPAFQMPELPQIDTGGLLGGGGVTDALQDTGLGGFKAASNAQIGGIGGPPEQPGGFGDKIGGFLGGLDQGLQSPSQLLGLGLLGQLGGNSPALPLLGLLGMGLFNKGQ